MAGSLYSFLLASCAPGCLGPVLLFRAQRALLRVARLKIPRMNLVQVFLNSLENLDLTLRFFGVEEVGTHD